MYDRDQHLQNIYSALLPIQNEPFGDDVSSKLQRPQKEIILAIGNFPRSILILDLMAAFNLSYLYDNIIKIFRQQGKVVQIMLASEDKAKPDMENDILSG